jgi:hypothetical protein
MRREHGGRCGLSVCVQSGRTGHVRCVCKCNRSTAECAGTVRNHIGGHFRWSVQRSHVRTAISYGDLLPVTLVTNPPGCLIKHFTIDDTGGCECCVRSARSPLALFTSDRRIVPPIVRDRRCEIADAGARAADRPVRHVPRLSRRRRPRSDSDILPLDAPTFRQLKIGMVGDLWKLGAASLAEELRS